MKRNIVLGLLLTITSLSMSAESVLDSLNYLGRVGYALGGTAPVNMPATIRKLNRYSLQANFTLGMDAYKRLGRQWGVMTGLHIDCKGMETDAVVKNYHMEMRRGGESLKGMFTGNVVTKVTQWSLTLPVLATYDVCSKVRLKLGPYFSYVLANSFDGYAYDGHLRRNTPTGTKVEIGSDASTRGVYDFSDDLRHFQMGIDVGADWYFGQRWGAYADVSWGLTGIFKSSFNTIEQTLYPIYGSLGLTYKFK